MKKRIVAMLCALAVVLATPGILPAQQAEAANAASGTTYYVSSIHGDNSNSGTSENEAWETLDKLESVVGTLKPGDQILLESGSVFNGFIHLQDVHGTEEAPIIISAYGEGEKPVINGEGQGIWFQDYGAVLSEADQRYKDYVSSTILLYDTDYVEISGLEITNKSNDEEYFAADDKIAQRMDRTGVAAIAKDGGTMEHTYLEDLYIHDVDGNTQDKYMNNGGIQLSVLQPENEASTGIAKYDDVKIDNCRVVSVSHAGISVGYTYNYAKLGTNVSDEDAMKYGHTNVQIENNYVSDVASDAVLAVYCYQAQVADNVLDYAGVESEVYTVTNTAISGISSKTTVKDFYANLVYADGLTLSVWHNDYEKTENEVITGGDVLKVESPLGAKKEYALNLITSVEYSPGGMTAVTGSHQAGNSTEGDGDLALDNNLGTMWHTDWNGTARENCWIQIDMGEVKEVSLLKYVPRTSGLNGAITKYEIYTKKNESDEWSKVSEGTWPADNAEKTAVFDAVEARYVKLVAVESYSDQAGNNFASAAEIRVGTVLTEEIDTAGLDALIKEAKAIETEGYTEASVKALTDALKSAEDVKADSAATQDEIYDAAAALQKAIRGLKTESSDPTEVKEHTESMVIAEQKQLELTILAGEKDVAWSTSDDVVVSVDNSGNVKALWPGEAEVAAEAGNKKEVFKITVAGTEAIFKDVNKDLWYYDVSNWAYVNGIMTGYGNDVYGGGDNLVRAQYAVILYRLAGSPEVEYKNVFPDVKETDFFADAVTWASTQGIITGYTSNGCFGPNDPITREQVATIMYRYAKANNYDVSKTEALDVYPDAAKVSAFAEDAMEWATGIKLITGDNGELKPQDSSVRVVAATIIQRFCKYYPDAMDAMGNE